MSEREGNGGPFWWGPPAGTNGPGRLDERGYAQNASFMTYLGPASCQFSIGSAVLRKSTKKKPHFNHKCLQTPGGSPIQTRLADVGPLERAQYDSRAAHDTREKTIN